MKNLQPKIKKILLKTLKNYLGSEDYIIYEKDNEIRLKNNDEYILTDLDELLATVPEKNHEGEFCFLCDGGYLWDLMNPCQADYPSYRFEEIIYANFKKAGLFLEPYASWRFDVTEY